MIRILIISDIRLYSEGLSEILGQLEGINVIGVASDLDSAILSIEKSAPDVVLQDMTMESSCRTVQYIITSCPDVKIVALAVPEDENNIFACAKAGITGYIAREASLDELLRAVQIAVKGELYCPQKFAASLMSKIRMQTASATRALKEKRKRSDALFKTLTKREWQIAGLVADGFSNKQIARHLTIEVSTVKNHVHSILVKMGVDSRGQAAHLLQHNTATSISGTLDLDPDIEINHI